MCTYQGYSVAPGLGSGKQPNPAPRDSVITSTVVSAEWTSLGPAVIDGLTFDRPPAGRGAGKDLRDAALG